MLTAGRAVVTARVAGDAVAFSGDATAAGCAVVTARVAGVAVVPVPPVAGMYETVSDTPSTDST